MQFLFFYTPKPRSQVWTFIIRNYWQTLFRTSLFTEFLFSLQLEIVQCPYENRNRGRWLSASPRVAVFKGRFILDYEHKMHTSSLSWKPTRLEPIVLWPTWPSPTPIAWKRIAQHFYFESFPISNQTKWRRLRYMKPLISPKSNQLRFYVSTQRFPKKRWSWFESAIRRSFFGESRRTPPKQKGKKDRLIAG